VPLETTLSPGPELDPFAPVQAPDPHLPTVPTGTPPLEPIPVQFDTRPARRRATAAETVRRVGEELVTWFKTLVSAAVYATLIVTFGFQVARVEGQSMAPTLSDQDRLIVNKLEYRLPNHAPRVGDIVMLLYPNDPDKSFVKRVVADTSIGMTCPCPTTSSPRNTGPTTRGGPRLCARATTSSWVITATTARTAERGDSCRRNTSSAGSSSAGGP
jgi:hypothetical protein